MSDETLLQNTSTRADINPPDPTGSQALARQGGKSRGADEDPLRDHDRDAINRADSARSEKGRAVLRRQAMPNGEVMVRNAVELRKAVNTFKAGKFQSETYSDSEIKRHIILRARELKLVGLLPADWGVNLEILREAVRSKKATKPEVINEVIMAEEFHSLLLLDGSKELPAPLVMEEKDHPSGGKTLRVKVPFYVGESVSSAPGFSKKIFFPTSLLQETIAEGKQRLAERKQPLTVYGRHAHAINADHLPMGGIVDLTQEGRVGYAILEIEPTTDGRDAQILLKANPPKLNAVSLRSGPKRFEMERVQVNGEEMFKPTKLYLDGVDFAPDSPAMPTYGIEILAAEARVVPVKSNEKEDSIIVSDSLTLEALKSEYPTLVEAIERPLLKRVDEQAEEIKTLSQEVSTLRSDKAQSELDAFVKEIASKHPKSAEVLPVLQEAAKSCKTKDELAAKVLPIILEALSATKKTPVVVESSEEKLRRLFGAGGTGAVNGVVLEEGEIEETAKGERVGPLSVPE